MELAAIFPSKYLKAEDLQGRDVPVAIAKCAMEELGDDTRLVIYFQNKQKGLICNKTNADRIALLYGPDTDGWIGKEIVLYTDMVNFRGQATQAIRVRPPVKRPTPVRTTAGSKPAARHVVEDKGSYSTSTMQAASDPIEEMVGADEIPF